jgi:hypothetical protein
MLYIITNNNSEIEWRIGERLLCFPIDQVFSVGADGKELEWIEENFNNIPMHKTARVQTWHGDIAKFIAGCLPVRY